MSHLIVISSDAMVGEDLEYFKTTRAYQKIFQGGAEITNVSSIYPSVTLPAHATMITGMYPEHHGIFSNMILDPGSDPTPWQMDYALLQCSDIFRAAKAVGKTTASVFWPVTMHNPAIDYHIADYWRENKSETLTELFARTGSSPEVMEIIEKHLHLLPEDEKQHPGRDEFGMACVADIIREFKPDVLFTHPANMDDVRHKNGVFGSHLKAAIDDLDRWLCHIWQAVEDAGMAEDTDIFLVSDHGQREVRRNISLNVLLAENGFITLKEDGSVDHWDAYCLSNGMSAVVFLRDKNDGELYRRVQEFLQGLLDQEVFGFSRIYTEAEAREEEHFGGPFSFVLETDGYTSFGDYTTRPLVRDLTNEDYRFGAATHGYLPKFGPHPMLLAKGPSIRDNTVLSGNHIVNEAPTYAKLLGADLPGTDGSPILEILK